LLNLLGGLDKATMGKIFIDGRDLFGMNRHQLMNYKRETVGFVCKIMPETLSPI
jgi:putative ABC transport system ATP-binding protein